MKRQRNLHRGSHPEADLQWNFGQTGQGLAMATQDAKATVRALAELLEFEPRHVPGALKLSQEMGWPYRQEDWAFAAEVGKGLVIERAGAVIGTAMYWTYGPDFASVGMIIVTAAEQGAGHGSRLFGRLLEAAGGRSVLLNSTEEGLALYRRNGFAACGTVLQYQGLPVEADASSARDDIRPATAGDLSAVQAFDERATGLLRPAMIAALAKVGSVAVIDRGATLAGYSIARRFGRGHVVGPVAAESAEDARQLILAQLAELSGQFVRIDVHAEHGLGDWLDSLGLRRVSDATFMVNGRRPVPDGAARTYALANQSFG